MRAVVAVPVIVALLVSPVGIDAFPPATAGPAPAPSPAAAPPPSPHLFPVTRSEGTRSLPPVLIVEVFYFALRDDEYVVLENPGASPVDLSGWRVTDGEGSAEFPLGAALPAGARAVVTRNATAYLEDTLDAADFTYDAGNATPLEVTGRVIQLNNDRDEVLLLDAAGAVVDAFVYGSSAYAGEGWVGPPAAKVGQGKRAVRAAEEGTPRDSDTAADWDSPRSFGLGQSDHPLRSFNVSGPATAFLSPDSASDLLLSRIRNATASVHASVYTFTSPRVADALVAAEHRGVEVRVLLEGGPVGGIDVREWDAAQRVRAAGGEVRFLLDDPVNDTMARYRYAHAKYAVVDARAVIVGSENWGEHGFPAAGRTGNRGWHIAVEDPALAVYFEAVFHGDFDPRRRDSRDIDSFFPYVVATNETPEERPLVWAIPPSVATVPLRVTPVIAPEHALREDALLGLLRSARETLDVEAFYLAKDWGAAGPNPYLEAVIDAARRGVRVRILLDGTWYNVEGDDPVDNDDTAAYVNFLARSNGLPLEARVGDAGARGLSKFHNKGVLVDGRTAFVSSLNWNRNAATSNREVGLIVEGASLVEAFRAAFERDWAGGPAPPPPDAGFVGNPLALPFLALVVANTALLWLVFRRRRRGGKPLSEGEGME